MPSVDDLLRQAFEAPDDEWVRGAASAHRSVVARHRRHLVVTRTVAAAACAAVIVGGAVSLTADTEPRTVAPADTPASTSPPIGGPLEGTWISEPLGQDDVRAAANRAGASKSATAMLEVLPHTPFRVVMVVRGSSLSTSVRTRGAADMLLDQETISTTGQQLELRPFDIPAATIHQWAVEGGVLTMSLMSTNEESKGGVPGEAWQRLLYDAAPLTRRGQ